MERNSWLPGGGQLFRENKRDWGRVGPAPKTRGSNLHRTVEEVLSAVLISAVGGDGALAQLMIVFTFCLARSGKRSSDRFVFTREFSDHSTQRVALLARGLWLEDTSTLTPDVIYASPRAVHGS